MSKTAPPTEVDPNKQYLAVTKWRGSTHVDTMRLFDDYADAVAYVQSLDPHIGSPFIYEFDKVIAGEPRFIARKHYEL